VCVYMYVHVSGSGDEDLCDVTDGRILALTMWWCQDAVELTFETHQRGLPFIYSIDFI